MLNCQPTICEQGIHFELSTIIDMIFGVKFNDLHSSPKKKMFRKVVFPLAKSVIYTL